MNINSRINHKFKLICKMLTIAVLLSGCTEMQLGSHFLKKITNGSDAPYSAPAITEKRKIGNPYEIMGKTYYPIASSHGYRRTGIASWYGKDFHGKKTANGKIYNMYEMTAAHPTLPLPTYVRVTNLDNGKSIVVKVNDRGPFLRGRLIDLSYRAALELAMAEKGTSPVLVEALPVDGSVLRRTKGNLAIASNQRDKTQNSYGIASQSQPTNKSSGGSFTNSVVNKNIARNSNRAFKYEDANQPVQEVELDKPQVANQVYDIVEGDEPEIGNARIYIQTGAFSDITNANRQQKQVGNIFNYTHVAKFNHQGRVLHRVRVGPIESVEQADEVLAKLISNGFNVARIVVN